MLRASIIFSLLLALVSSCHYSCATCFMGDSFVNCTTCPSGALQIMQDPDKGITQNFYYHRFTGVCNQPDNPPLNILGIVLLLVSVGAAIYTKQRECMIWINSAQNICLLGLLNTSFVSPISYIIQSFQYFFLLSKTTLNTKTQSDNLQKSGYYQLQSFLGTEDYIYNAVPLGITLGLVGFILAVLIFVQGIWLQNLADQPKRKLWLRAIKKYSLIVRYVFYFMIEEEILLLVVAILYGTMFDGAKILIGFYLSLFIYFCVYSYYRSVRFFGSRYLAFFNYLKKVILPVLVCFPIPVYILPAAMLICTVLESIFQFKMNIIKQKRYYLYRGFQALSILVFIAYLVVQDSNIGYSASVAIGAISTVAFLVFMSVPFVELGLFVHRQYVARQSAVAQTNPVLAPSRVQGNIKGLESNMNQTKQNLHTSEFNDSNLEQIKLEEMVQPNPDMLREELYKFEEEAEPVPQIQLQIKDTGKKLTEKQAEPPSEPVQQMGAIKKKRVRDANRQKNLRAAYGIK